MCYLPFEENNNDFEPRFGGRVGLGRSAQRGLAEQGRGNDKGGHCGGTSSTRSSIYISKMVAPAYSRTVLERTGVQSDLIANLFAPRWRPHWPGELPPISAPASPRARRPRGGLAHLIPIKNSESTGQNFQ